MEFLKINNRKQKTERVDTNEGSFAAINNHYKDINSSSSNAYLRSANKEAISDKSKYLENKSRKQKTVRTNKGSFVVIIFTVAAKLCSLGVQIRRQLTTTNPKYQKIF